MAITTLTQDKAAHLRGHIKRANEALAAMYEEIRQAVDDGKKIGAWGRLTRLAHVEETARLWSMVEQEVQSRPYGDPDETLCNGYDAVADVMRNRLVANAFGNHGSNQFSNAISGVHAEVASDFVQAAWV